MVVIEVEVWWWFVGECVDFWIEVCLVGIVELLV